MLLISSWLLILFGVSPTSRIGSGSFDRRIGCNVHRVSQCCGLGGTVGITNFVTDDAADDEDDAKAHDTHEDTVFVDSSERAAAACTIKNMSNDNRNQI